MLTTLTAERMESPAAGLSGAGAAAVWQRVFDFAGAIAGFIFFSIRFLVVPVLIKLDSKGPIFCGQQRPNLNLHRGDRRQVTIAVAHDRRAGEHCQQDLFGRPYRV